MAEKLLFENARIIYRNFRGEASQYNRAGSKTFNVVIPNPQMAVELKVENWNVKHIEPRDPEDAGLYHMPVAVSFANYPPSIYLICGNKKRQLNEATVSMLDYIDIESIDMVIRPHTWDDNGVARVKAYLGEMYVTQRVDAFAEKYAAYAEETDEEVPFD